MKYSLTKHLPLRFLHRVCILLSLSVLCFFNVAPVNALTESDFYSINTNTSMYDPADTNSCSADPTPTDDSTSNSDAQTIASTLIIGFDASTTPKSVISDLASKYHIGGMYLVHASDSPIATKDSNASEKGFTKSFYDSLNTSDHKLVIASDEEGVVTRYYYPPGTLPTAGQMTKQNDAAVTNIGVAAGKVMAGNGLTADLAPVLDLRDVGTGLNGRSFSSNPTLVSDKAGAFAHGLQTSDITPIFKHFPGFDSSTSGSTDDNVVVMKGSIKNTVAPYKVLLAKYPKAGVMLSNMYVDALDKANPSSMSAATVKYLRSTLNFKSLITTDDLSVSSVTNKAGSLGDAVANSLQAGVDMPLFTLPASSADVAEKNLDKIIATVQSNTAAMASIAKESSVLSTFTGNKGDAPATVAAGCCSASTGTLTGDDNKSKIFSYFIGQGLGAAGAAGIMGNMSAESHFDPSIEQSPGAWEDMSDQYYPASKGGVGLVQWDGGRRPAAIKYLMAHGLTDADLHHANDTLLINELNYVWKELNNSYQSTLQNIQKDTDPAKAAYDFHKGYEGSSDSEAAIKSNREDPAEAIYQKYNGAAITAGSQPSVAADSTGCANSSQSPNCTAAAGVAKILCAAKAYDTASYEYGAEPRNGPAWHQQCPTIGPSCKVDCSLLVTLAVYDAFKVVLPGTDTSGERSDRGKYWKKIVIGQLQPGDIIQPDTGHVEVVDHVQQAIRDDKGKIIKPALIYTFGAHQAGIPQPQQVNPSQYGDSPDNLYLHYIGPDKS